MTAMKEMPLRKLQLLDGVAVSLGVEVSRVSLRLSDLMDLMPGTRLDLPLERRETVLLLLGDMPIAEAKLFNEDGNFFLEITEVFNSEETSANSGR